ncbi:MAG: DUF4445 domain-containing protein [Nitrospirales bacterium]|nr:DUF4445 domain-containing protein [Nitrospirales bacterium]
MPLLSIRTDEGIKRIEFREGASLREILDTTDSRVRSGCRGNGSCGLCRVQIHGGVANSPTSNELIHLPAPQIKKGLRLACQTVPFGDIEITILNPSPPSQWKKIPGGKILRNSENRKNHCIALPADIKNAYGLAVDIGTTHISLSLCNLLTGERISDRYGQNPQSAYGLDVMTRLTAAAESEKTAWLLKDLIISAIGKALMDMSSREGLDLRYVVYVAIVGNTAMLAMLSGRNYLLLLQPKNWASYIDCLPEGNPPWHEEWGIHPKAVIDPIPPLAGFVGSDLLAGLVSARISDSPDPQLFIDFGTNSEIALWDGKSLLVTSAAGGPAFESWGVACGMPAEAGAVYRVSLKGEKMELTTLFGATAKGLCGTGLIDLITLLVRTGRLSPTGKFHGNPPPHVIALSEGISLKARDIDAFQRAKAGIGTAITILLSESGIPLNSLSRISVAGAFGKLLHVPHAQEIGLLPPIDPLKVELMGNTALAGCEDIMLSTESAERLSDIRTKAKIINLAQHPRFGEVFLDNLYLKPMGS